MPRHPWGPAPEKGRGLQGQLRPQGGRPWAPRTAGLGPLRAQGGRCLAICTRQGRALSPRRTRWPPVGAQGPPSLAPGVLLLPALWLGLGLMHSLPLLPVGPPAQWRRLDFHGIRPRVPRRTGRSCPGESLGGGLRRVPTPRAQPEEVWVVGPERGDSQEVVVACEPQGADRPIGGGRARTQAGRARGLPGTRLVLIGSWASRRTRAAGDSCTETEVPPGGAVSLVPHSVCRLSGRRSVRFSSGVVAGRSLSLSCWGPAGRRSSGGKAAVRPQPLAGSLLSTRAQPPAGGQVRQRPWGGGRRRGAQGPRVFAVKSGLGP